MAWSAKASAVAPAALAIHSPFFYRGTGTPAADGNSVTIVNWQLTSTFEGTPGGVSPFVTTNSFPDTVYKVSAGIDIISTNKTGGLDLRLYYEGQFAQGYRSNTGALKASVRF